MRRFGTSLLTTMLVFTLHGYAKDPVLSTELLHDTYVALGFETAQGFVPEDDIDAILPGKILPEDRQALANIRDVLRAWKRYTIVIDPHAAELLIAVRTGRVASAHGGVQVGNIPVGGVPGMPGGTRSTQIGPVYGAEVGPGNDYLAVYQAKDGREGANLWRHTEADGLVGKNPPLFESFKKDVEALAKKYAKH